MSPVDTAWLRMEELANQMTITAVLTFEAPLDRADLRRAVEERLLSFERFRQRVRRGRFDRRPRWEPDPDFDLDRHLHTVCLPEPAGKAALQEQASALMSRPLPFAHPLWQFHLVENYAGGAALIARLHHCIADGFTLVRVLLSLTDRTPSGAPPDGASGNDLAGAFPGGERGNAGTEAPPPSLRQRVAAALTDFGKKGARGAELLARGAGVLGKLAWPAPEPDTSLRGELGRQKNAAWSAPVPLADVKAAGRALGGTVNDVLMAVLTGALRRYLRERNELPAGDSDLDLRAAVPVNLRPHAEGSSAQEPSAMGNGFGLVFLALPVGRADPQARLAEVRRRMNRIKRSPEAAVLLGLLGLVGASGPAVEERIVSYLARKVTAVATNVPGPQETLYLAGAPMDTLMAWVPKAGRVGLGASIISYDGDVRLGLATDAGLVPEPEAILAAFRRELDALTSRASGERTPGEEEMNAAAESDAEAHSGNTPVPATASSPDRCQATTQAGTQCKLPAQDGARFCHVHRES
jgi:WS/DGAT/MGAT family acyltransferase